MEDLEGELGQPEFASEFVKNALAIVVRVDEASIFVLEDEIILEHGSRLSLAFGKSLDGFSFFGFRFGFISPFGMSSGIG